MQNIFIIYVILLMPAFFVQKISFSTYCLMSVSFNKVPQFQHFYSNKKSCNLNLYCVFFITQYDFRFQIFIKNLRRKKKRKNKNASKYTSSRKFSKKKLKYEVVMENSVIQGFSSFSMVSARKWQCYIDATAYK